MRRLVCGTRQSLDAAFEVSREFQACSGHGLMVLNVRGSDKVIPRPCGVKTSPEDGRKWRRRREAGLALSQIRANRPQEISRSSCSYWWAVLGSNQWPLPCESSLGVFLRLPLSMHVVEMLEIQWFQDVAVQGRSG